MKLSNKILIFVILILFFSVGSISYFTYAKLMKMSNDNLEESLQELAYYVSRDVLVKKALRHKEETGDIDYSLNEHIEDIREHFDVNFITVFDMDGIRLTHPNEENIGYKFKGGDEDRVLKEAISYISSAEGTLGESIRAFEPIFYEDKQVGAVCVGSVVTDIFVANESMIKPFYTVLAFGVGLGLVGAAILTINIKIDTLGLEPKQIALMFKQNEAILDNVKEGIITLNAKGEIVQYNKEAGKILGLTAKDIGSEEKTIFSQYKEFASNRRIESTDEFEVKVKPGVTILCKVNTLRNDKDKTIGEIINFRDLSEVKKMADELTGIKKLTWSLRAQNHEFLNKLHTIMGLIELEEYDEVLKYISNTVITSDNISKNLINNIKSKSVVALVLEKYYKAEEMRIELEVDSDSRMDKRPKTLSADELNSVIGNLIENSLDALSVDGTGKINLKIIQADGKLVIRVKDNGPGIPSDIRGRIFERGVTTKEDGKGGYGLYIVYSIIEGCGGKIEFFVDKGTTWYVEIPYEGSVK